MKEELRNEIIHARTNQSQEEVEEKSSKIISKLINLPVFQEAKTVMIYLDFRNEVRTGQLVEMCFEHDKRVIVPITDFKTKKLIPSELLYYPEDLTTNRYGISEPKAECIRPVDVYTIDLIIVPGVAFDEKGNRLGYGGGFYDRFLRQTRKDTVNIALAFELQIRENVYPEEHDFPVHIIITEARVINTGTQS